MWRFLKSLVVDFGLFADFRRDRRGAAALLFGLTLIPMVAGVGMGIDYTRAQTLKKQLGHALDAAALAVGSWQGLSDAEIQQKANDYFDANFSPRVGTAGDIAVSVNGVGKGFPVAALLPVGRISGLRVQCVLCARGGCRGQVRTPHTKEAARQASVLELSNGILKRLDGFFLGRS
jgi:hypothetical protein